VQVDVQTAIEIDRPRARTTYTWEDRPGGGTRMTLRNQGRPAGFARIAGPVMAAAVRRANRKDLRRLKQILEAPGESP
jgi:hypothetical protein